MIKQHLYCHPERSILAELDTQSKDLVNSLRSRDQVNKVIMDFDVFAFGKKTQGCFDFTQHDMLIELLTMHINPKTTIYSIVGTTSSGKTDYAFDLAQKMLGRNQPEADHHLGGKADEVWIISADSKQVYKGLEILTGADIPEGFVRSKEGDGSIDCGYDYLIGNVLEVGFERDSLVSPSAGSESTQNDRPEIKLFGISCIEPDQEWSVGHFQKLVYTLLAKKKENTLVLIVGGTGLYHDSIFKTDNGLSIPPNQELRKKMENMSVEELQVWLQEINPEKFESMNNSDRNNPRRLQRAIEVGVHNNIDDKDRDAINRVSTKFNHQYIGLHTNIDDLEEKIKKRIIQRLDGGAIKEVKSILDWGKNTVETQDFASVQYYISDQIQSIIGFQEISDYLDKKITREDCIQKWAVREMQYAKRQITWWKKRKDVAWIKKDY